MIPRDIARTLGQIGDPRFMRVLATGIALTLALLVVAGALAIWGLNVLVPDNVSLPWIGPVGWLDDLASGAGVAALLVASVFLMVPVASAFTSFFLDDVVDAVEARHYPMPPAPRLSFGQSLLDGLGFLGILLLANAVALIVYLVLIPIAPLVFLAMNGWLLGREYFQLIARRRLGADGARTLRRRHGLQIWLLGIAMAAPLLIPVVNLTVPVLGAAAFTHLFHRVSPRATAPSGRTSPDRAR